MISNCSDFFAPESTCDGRFALYNSGINTDNYKVFEIGTETGCENRGYCNGPLKPDTAYYITLRAYTTGGFKDTPFSEAVRTEKICKCSFTHLFFPWHCTDSHPMLCCLT